MKIKFIYRLILLSIFSVSISSCEKFESYNYSEYMNNKTTDLISAEKAERLTNLVCNTQNSNKLFGIQLSIRDNLNESWDVSFGTTDLKQKHKLENQHILRIGSVTKIYTSALILKLIELNYIELEQTLSDFFPEYKNVRDVTIKNLLNHSSGIVDIFTIPSIFISASNFPDKQWNPNRLAETCMEKKLSFEQGSKHQYSNTNYIILGLIAEKATGQKINELFNQYLFLPNNLNSTYLVPYMDTPKSLINGYVHHFALSLKKWYVNEPDNTSWATIGFTAGAMSSNSTDLSAFTYKLFNGEILNDESLNLMTSFNDNYGLGVFKIKVNDNYYWGHEGEISGFEAITVYNPQTEIVISICCNTTPFRINDLLNKIDAEL